MSWMFEQGIDDRIVKRGWVWAKQAGKILELSAPLRLRLALGGDGRRGLEDYRTRTLVFVHVQKRQR